MNDKNYLGILQSLIDIRENIPRQQKKLCDYIIENYQSIGVLTVSQLAAKAGVGTTTVMRLLKRLGYDSYNQMKKDLYELTINSNKNTWWHLEKSFKSTTKNNNSNTLQNSLYEIVSILEKTLKDPLLENFYKSVDLILKANTIHILGLRSSVAAAIYFEHLLGGFYPKTKQLSHNSDYVFDRISQFEDGDLLFLITNSPFTNRSLEAAKFCSKQGHPLILVTDHLSCPASTYADVILLTEPSQKQYTIVPTITVLESIVIEVGRKTSETSIQQLNQLAQILKQNHITRS